MLIIEAAVLYLNGKEVIILLDRVLWYLMSLPAKRGKTSLDARLKTAIYSARKRNKKAGGDSPFLNTPQKKRGCYSIRSPLGGGGHPVVVLVHQKSNAFFRYTKSPTTIFPFCAVQNKTQIVRWTL